MAATPSTMVEVGTPMPKFSLTDTVSGSTIDDDYFNDARAALIMFICNHCPFVIHVRDELINVAKEYAGKGVKTVAISANDPVTHGDDSPEKMAELARKMSFPFPYLFDESQEVAKSFKAACTPDFFLYDSNRRLYYRGQLDDSRPGNDKPVDGRDLRAAIDTLLAGGPPPSDQRASMGCNIKWKPGNEPDYYS